MYCINDTAMETLPHHLFFGRSKYGVNELK